MTDSFDVTEYLQRPYARIVVPQGAGSYYAEILEFPGCLAQGRSQSEALESLEKVATNWLRAALQHGETIPIPSIETEYSGRILLRLPKTLHRHAAIYAQRDGTSLNQFIVAALAERVGTSRGASLPFASGAAAESVRVPVSAPLMTSGEWETVKVHG